jgi:hypothetical protein
MFKKAVFSYTFMLVGIVAAWLFLTLHISSKDLMRFKELKKKGQAIASTSKSSSATQNRAGVRKDLWITQEGGKRLHNKIESASSILTLTPIDDHMEIIENLHQIRCSMQDKIINENGKITQQVRYFDANSGLYQYSISRFSAETVYHQSAPGEDKRLLPGNARRGLRQRAFGFRVMQISRACRILPAAGAALPASRVPNPRGRHSAYATER